MKKTFVAVLIAMLCALAFMSTAMALEEGDFSYSIGDDQTVTIEGYLGSDGSVAVPAQIAELPVARIGADAFYNHDEIYELILPDTILEIGEEAFYSCDYLESVNLPEGLMTIQDGAFQYCSSLPGLVLPAGLTHIGENVFYGCDALTELTVPDNLTDINNAFSGYPGHLFTGIGSDAARTMSLADVPFSITGYPDVRVHYAYADDGSGTRELTGEVEAYAWDESISAAVIPEGITRIGENGFNNCDSLTEIELPAGITTIGTCGFFDCDSLTSVVLPSGMKEIGEKAFDNCDYLESVNLPEGLATIQYGAFQYCPRLPGLELPESLMYLGGDAFNGCDALAELIVPDNLTDMENAFNWYPGHLFTGIGGDAARTMSLADVPFSITGYPDVRVHYAYADDGSGTRELTGEVEAYAWDDYISAAVIPEGITRIGENGFNNCDSLTEIELPVGITAIGTCGFFDCDSLTSVVLPSGMKEIGEKAFDNCDYLESVNLPEGLATIQYGAFQYCSRLPGLELPESLMYLGGDAFNGCDALAELIVPDNLTDMENAFNWYPGHLFTSIGGDAARTMSLADVPFSVTGYPDVRVHYAYADDGSGMRELTGEVEAYAWDESISAAAIPEGVTCIAENGFNNCDSLTEIAPPIGITRIKAYAFNDCDNLASVILPSGLKEIGAEAFYSCDSLTSVQLPAGLTTIQYGAFQYCYNLPAMELPDSLLFIGENAFYECSAMAELMVPDSLTDMENAFYGYPGHLFTGLDSEAARTMSLADVPFSVTGYPNVRVHYAYVDDGSGTRELTGEVEAYAWDESISAAVIPEGVTCIAESGFYNCDNLTEIALPIGTTVIKAYGFNDCDNLIAVTLPSGLAEIGEQAFRYCPNLASVPLPEGLQFIRRGAFEYCAALTRLDLPEGLKFIGSYAFNGCDGIEEMVIPDSVTSAESSAFSGFSGLLYASIDSFGAKAVSAEHSFLVADYPDIVLQYEYVYDSASSTNVMTGELDVFARDTNIENAVIPEGVTRIGSNGFYDCDRLNGMIIPEGVLSICESGLSNCNYLSYVSLPSTLETIGGWAFDGCNNLTDILLPDSLKRIERSAFAGCSALTELQLPAGLEFMGNSAFDYCGNLASVSVPDSVTEMESGVFSNYSGQIFAGLDSVAAHRISADSRRFSLIENPDVSLWYEYVYNSQTETNDPTGELDAFAWNNETDRVVIPEDVTRIGNYGFSGCGNLSEALIPSGVTAICEGAFYNCSSLVEMNIPESVTRIGDSAFQSCGNLVSITLPSTLTEIGNYVFDNCYQLADISLPAGVKRIGQSAFEDCQSFETLVLPDGLESIDSNAFYRCYNLKELLIPESVTQVASGAFDGFDGRVYAVIGSEGAKAVSRASYKFSVAGYPDVQMQYRFASGQASELDVYAWNSEILSAEIPAGVTRVAQNGFEYCGELETVIIPDSVKNIAGYAFRECEKLQNLTLPDSLTSIGTYAFYGCSSLESLAVPEGITVIAVSTFCGCSGLDSVTLPESLTSIGAQAFANCSSLKKLKIPDGVTTVSASAVSGNSGILYAEIGSQGAQAVSKANYYFRTEGNDDVKMQYTFSGGEIVSLKAMLHTGTAADVVIPEGVTYLAAGSFRQNTLRQAVIPDSVETIEENAFPKNQETLTVGCASAARAWAESSGYPRDTEAGESAFMYVVVHRAEETDPAAEPTCTETGLTEGSHCETCAEIIVPQEIIAALGHDWSEPVYTWAENNLSVTASHLCRRDDTHAESETAAAEWTLILSPTETERGARQFTSAAFENEAFESQSRTEDISALNEMNGLKLPAMMKQLEEEALANGAFEYVVVPEGCESVGSRAFADCAHLIYVRIPAGTSVAEDAFDGCRPDLIIDR